MKYSSPSMCEKVTKRTPYIRWKRSFAGCDEEDAVSYYTAKRTTLNRPIKNKVCYDEDDLAFDYI